MKAKFVHLFKRQKLFRIKSIFFRLIESSIDNHPVLHQKKHIKVIIMEVSVFQEQ